MDIIDTYYKSFNTSAIQIESYNKLVTKDIYTIIENKTIGFETKQQTFSLIFRNVHLGKPTTLDRNRNARKILPYEARERDMSYETDIYADIEAIFYDNSTGRVLNSQVHLSVVLFKMPVMVRSCICNLTDTHDLENEDPNDHGGYFIIKGKERVLVAQERINYNRLYIYKLKEIYVAEIRSIKECANYSVLLQIKVNADKKIVISLPYISHDIPIAILFIALGSDPRMVEEYIANQDELTLFNRSIIPYLNMTKNQCLEYISEYTLNKVEDAIKLTYTINILKNEILPHFGIDTNMEVKCRYLCVVISKLLQTEFGRRKDDDRDHIGNKRVEMTGELIGNLITSLFKRSMKTIQQTIEKRNDYNVINIINRFNITQRLYYCFSTGNWGLSNSNYIRQGVSQVLSRISYIGTVSHLNRVVVPIGRESRNTQVRQIHSTNYGYICPVETPEGQSCGIVKSFTIFARLSDNVDTVVIIDVIETLMADFDLKLDRIGGTLVLINGIWVGSIEKESVPSFIDKFKLLRSIDIIPYDTSIAYYDFDNQLDIYSDGGRIIRPVYQISKLTDDMKDMEWSEMVDKNIIVYIDGMEAETTCIAMTKNDITEETEYMELTPMGMLGICANIIPFSDHSQAPRNVYASAMCKQAIGMYSLAHNKRYDTMSHVLNYPQKRLVSTKIARTCGFEEMVTGINCVVAVMCMGSWGTEDSVILNKSAVERGLFNSTSYRTTSINENKKGTHDCEVIEVPRPDIRNKDFNYLKLGANGIVPRGAFVEKNDVLVGKVYYSPTNAATDCSLICKANECGFVDTIIDTVNGNGYRHVKIKILQVRIPEVADKLASVHAQKGTIGMMFRQEDMPFTADGIVPDLIINPLALPSRMTINMLMEMLCGKLSTLTGEMQDASAFEHDGEKLLESVSAQLIANGYDGMGNELLYNGATGQPLKAKIFMGPCYYQRLKHLVSEKIHCLTMDHQILTVEGWKYFHNLTLSDKLATLNHGELEYTAPTNLHYYPEFSGEILTTKHLSVTMDHKMYVSRQDDGVGLFREETLVKASDIIDEPVQYKHDARWCCQEYDFHGVTSSDAWITLVAIVAVYGKPKNYIAPPVQVIIPENNKSILYTLYPALTELGYKHNFGTDVVEIHNFFACRHFVEYNVWETLPEWCFELSQRQAEIMIKSVETVAGFIHTPKALDDDILRLILHAGHVGMKTDTGIRILRERETEKSNLSSVSVRADPVFCVTVPSGIFYVRKGETGMGVWTGNSRSTGDVQLLSRQPTAGRSRDGGLRIGNMETDAMISHGISYFLKERLFDLSDPYQITLCSDCGILINNLKECFNCGSDKNETVNIPYAAKLLFQELEAMAIKIRIKSK